MCKLDLISDNQIKTLEKTSVCGMCEIATVCTKGTNCEIGVDCASGSRCGINTVNETIFGELLRVTVDRKARNDTI